MSINNNKNVLLRRIKRLVSENKEQSRAGRWIAGITLTALVLVFALSSFISKASMVFFQKDPKHIPAAVIAPRPSVEVDPTDVEEPVEAAEPEIEVEDEEDPDTRKLFFDFIDRDGTNQDVRFEFSPDGKEVVRLMVNDVLIPKEKFTSNKKIMDFVKKYQMLTQKRREVEMQSEKEDIAREKEELKYQEIEMKEAIMELEDQKEELKWQQAELARRENELARRSEDLEYQKAGKRIPDEKIKKREQEEALWKVEEKKQFLHQRERESKEKAKQAEHIERQKLELKHRQLEIEREKKEIEIQENEMKFNKEFEQLFDEEIKNLK